MRPLRYVLSIAVLAVVCLFGATARATTLTVSGYLNDPGNAALASSDGYLDLGAPRFGGDDLVARNVAIYTLTVANAATFTFDSHGFAAGGAEPYFTLFEGSDAAAAFLDSNYFIPDIDFSLTRALSPGTYLLAIGVWVNQSFAENNPDGDPTLGDGFTALGDPTLLGNAYYELDASADARFDIAAARIAAPAAPVPEPSTIVLVGLGLVGRRLAKMRRSAA